jgi:hypothetical protein
MVQKGTRKSKEKRKYLTTNEGENSMKTEEIRHFSRIGEYKTENDPKRKRKDRLYIGCLCQITSKFRTFAMFIIINIQKYFTYIL